MKRTHVLGIACAIATIAVLVGVIYWWQRGGQTPDASATPTGASSPTADQLRKTPLRTRWAPPICQPSGVVHLADGSPAVNATVVLQEAPLSQQLAIEPVDAPDTQTDASGRFTLPPTAAGAWLVIAALPHERAGVRAVRIGSATDCTNLDVTLGAAGIAVTGVITDVSGGPVKGALVVVRPAAAPTGQPLALAASHEDGRYELAVSAGDYAITVRHPEYVGVDGQLSVKRATSFDAVLTPGASIRGVVMTRDPRTPVAGAKVTIHGGRASGAMGGLVREVVSDEHGHFVFTGLGSGRMQISAVGPESASRDAVEIALGIAESRDDIEVVVDPARRIRGVVTRATKPVAGALVFGFLSGDSSASGADERIGVFQEGGFTGEITAETDAAGVFELWGLAPGGYELSATAPQSVSSESVHADTSRADVDNVTLELGAGVVVRGRVEPPQIAQVSVGGGVGAFETSGRWISASDVTTTADGRFEISGVEPGETTVSATAEGGLSGETKLTVGATGATDVVVALSPQGVTITGRVTDTNGKPVAGVNVGGWNAVTGTDGTFRAHSVDPGQVLVTVTDNEEQLEVKTPDNTITVPAEGISDLAVVVEARDRTLRGVVIGANGKPAADAWVVAVTSYEAVDGEPDVPPDLSSGAFDWTGRNKVALTDADGRFAITGLAAGIYDVAAEGDKGASRGVTHKVKLDRAVRVQLTALAGLTITAVRGGAPLARYHLEVMGPEPDELAVTAINGQTTLRNLPPGEYSLLATTNEGAGKATVTLAQGMSATATITVGTWATVAGQIVDSATGKPLSGVTALVDNALLSPDTGDTPPWISDVNGRFRIDRVPAGPGEVVVYTGLGDGVHVPFTAADDGRVDVGIVRVEPAPPAPPDLPEDDPSGAVDDQ